MIVEQVGGGEKVDIGVVGHHGVACRVKITHLTCSTRMHLKARRTPMWWVKESIKVTAYEVTQVSKDRIGFVRIV